MQGKPMIKKVIEIDLAKCDYIKIACHKCGTATELTFQPNYDEMECVVCKRKIQADVLELAECIFRLRKKTGKRGADVISAVSFEDE